MKVIFFDLGSTLIYAKDPWAEFFRLGDAALLRALRHAGLPLVGETFHAENGTFIDRYYAQYMPTDTTERTAFSVLREILAEKGYRNVPDPILRAALDALYAVTNRNWYAEEDALPTLAALRDAGYRLGLISNTSDDAHVQDLVDRNGFRPYFESVTTSAGLGIRKPDRRIFQAALDHFRVPPAAAAMVGDMLEADVLGANGMGMYSIWITRRAASGPDPAIVPQATVAALHEIPPLLASLK
ncbi:MAG: phosphatase of the haloacid dehalogenase (HAD)-like hydrolase family [Anaerolineaceae bacterium]|nr:MAG: phosphatase of the haloacid dehalogenase (HAD)-like hydrolase family [Anaerolineaceae bacterium]